VAIVTFDERWKKGVTRWRINKGVQRHRPRLAPLPTPSLRSFKSLLVAAGKVKSRENQFHEGSVQRLRCRRLSNCRYVERKMQVGDHMQVIVLACKERDALPAASRGQFPTSNGGIIFWRDGLVFDIISASVYSRMLEIARAMQNRIRGQRSCGRAG
jgi:hypothetical protein